MLDKLANSHLGNWVMAAAFFPVGLIWWDLRTDFIWTVGGTLVIDGLLLAKRRRLK